MLQSHTASHDWLSTYPLGLWLSLRAWTECVTSCRRMICNVELVNKVNHKRDRISRCLWAVPEVCLWSYFDKIGVLWYQTRSISLIVLLARLVFSEHSLTESKTYIACHWNECACLFMSTGCSARSLNMNPTWMFGLNEPQPRPTETDVKL